MDFAKLYQGIDEEDRLAIEAMPRAERLPHIATLQNVATREKVMEIAELSGLPYLENIDLVDNPAGVLPLRLMNEYQCVPIKNGQSNVEKEASIDETGPDTSEDAPIPLVTLWPPDQRMDRWIYADASLNGTSVIPNMSATPLLSASVLEPIVWMSPIFSQPKRT